MDKQSQSTDVDEPNWLTSTELGSLEAVPDLSSKDFSEENVTEITTEISRGTSCETMNQTTIEFDGKVQEFFKESFEEDATDDDKIKSVDNYASKSDDKDSDSNGAYKFFKLSDEEGSGNDERKTGAKETVEREVKIKKDVVNIQKTQLENIEDECGKESVKEDVGEDIEEEFYEEEEEKDELEDDEDLDKEPTSIITTRPLPVITEEDEKRSSSKTTSSSDKIDQGTNTSESSNNKTCAELKKSMEKKKHGHRKTEKDSISVSSSLLEFENLEKEIIEKGSVSSVSVGQTAKQSAKERDDASVTSSLAEFENLEKEIMDQPGSQETESKSSGSSAAELDFHKQKGHAEDRYRSSSSSSLAEFEQLEQQMKVDEELSVEAQKVALMLEKGSLPIRDDISDSDSSKEKSSKTSAEGKPEVAFIVSEVSKTTTKTSVSTTKYPPYQDIVGIIRKASEKKEAAEKQLKLKEEKFKKQAEAKKEKNVESSLHKAQSTDSLQDVETTSMSISGMTNQFLASASAALDEVKQMMEKDVSTNSMVVSTDSLGLTDKTMVTSTDSLEDVGLSMKYKTCKIKSTTQSTDSLEVEDYLTTTRTHTRKASYDSDSLQEQPTVMAKSMSQDSLKDSIAESMDISSESGAWSQMSSQQSSVLSSKKIIDSGDFSSPQTSFTEDTTNKKTTKSTTEVLDNAQFVGRQKLAEQELREQQELFQQQMERSIDGDSLIMMQSTDSIGSSSTLVQTKDPSWFKSTLQNLFLEMFIMHSCSTISIKFSFDECIVFIISNF